MKFFINTRQKSKKHSDSDLNKLLNLLKTNEIILDKQGFLDSMNFLIRSPNNKLQLNTQDCTVKLLGRMEKEDQVGFIPSIVDDIPVIEDGFSYVYIDLDIKKFPNYTEQQILDKTDIMFQNYSLSSQDDNDFRKGLIFVRKSSSLKGLNLLFRVKATINKEDIKSYSIEILRRLREQEGTNVFVKVNNTLVVSDPSGWYNNRKMYFNFSEPDNFWINPVEEYLELDQYQLDKNSEWFGVNGRNVKVDKLKPKPKSIDELWIMSGGNDFETIYKVGGNHARIYRFCGFCQTYNISKDEAIDWISKNRPDILDSNKSYNENETTRFKMHRLWGLSKAMDIKDTDLEKLIVKGKVNKELLNTKLIESNLVLLKSYDSLDRSRDFYSLENNILTKTGIKEKVCLNDIDWYTDFVNKLELEDIVSKDLVLYESKRRIYETANFRVIDFKNDLVRDTEDICYLYVKEGILKIEKGKSPVVLKDGLYLSDWISRENFNGLKGDPISYNEDLKLSDWDENNFFNTCVDTPISLKKTIGYQLYRYKTSNSIVNYIDGFNVSGDDDAGSGGGTGKTLVCYLLKSFRNVLELSSPDTDRFWLESLTPDHDILLLNEVTEDFNIKKVRNFYDMNISKECKGKPIENLSGDLVPRVLMNTNFPIIDDDKPTERRWVSIPFNNNWQGISMKSRFGHNWFRSKQTKEWWSYLLLFAIDCIQLYLNDPILKNELTKEMISRKKEISTINHDKDIIYYDLVWEELLKNKEAFHVNGCIININKEERRNLGSNKVYKYLHNRVNEYTEDGTKFEMIKFKKGTINLIKMVPKFPKPIFN